LESTRCVAGESKQTRRKSKGAAAEEERESLATL